MPYVVTPIPPELRTLALHLTPGAPAEALEAVAGQEHLLTDSGFVAHLAHMMGLLCLSPASAGQMIQMAQEVRDALAKATATIPASEFKALQRYADACALIAEVAAFQQGLFLAYLRRGLVEQPLAERLNVPVEHLDAAVNLLKLARKNSDGTPWKHGEEWR